MNREHPAPHQYRALLTEFQALVGEDGRASLDEITSVLRRAVSPDWAAIRLDGAIGGRTVVLIGKGRMGRGWARVSFPLQLPGLNLGRLTVARAGAPFDREEIRFLRVLAPAAAVLCLGGCLEVSRQRSPRLCGRRILASVGLHYRSREMNRVARLLERLLPSWAPVLVTGESGTGKELLARALHGFGPQTGKLVTVNCAALPGPLLESELFGHERGAFTGAVRRKPGLIALARDGTLFLDEVTELPRSLQAKLLRSLQEGEVRAVGASEAEKIRFRVVAATNSDVERKVRQGRFRADLYFRLSVLRINLPPLRQRGGDIPLLAEHFLVRYASPERPPLHLGGAAREALLSYHWPGNVRELENAVLRAVHLAEGSTVRPEDLGLPKSAARRRRLPRDLQPEEIIQALQACGGNVRQAARRLQIGRSSLYRRLERLRIRPGPFRPRRGEAP